MFTSLQNPLSLIGRILLALLFVPSGFSKIGGFAGTVGYIASKGVPLPELAAAAAIGVELGLGCAGHCAVYRGHYLYFSQFLGRAR